jgi:hypothetical protein
MYGTSSSRLKFLDPFRLFGAYTLRQRRHMAGIYQNVDPNVNRLLMNELRSTPHERGPT